LLTPEDLARMAQLASALEVCGHPKPGNVHRTSDFPDSTFEQFVASTIAIGPAMLLAARRGFSVGRGELSKGEVGLGGIMREAMGETRRWQRDGNTNLGTILLLVPLTSAAGWTLAEEGRVEGGSLRRRLSELLRATTPEDAVGLYQTVLLAEPAGLGRLEELDVNDPRSQEELRRRGISAYEVMRICSGWDDVAREWVTDYSITFEFGYPTLTRIYRETGSINTTTVQTFLELLAFRPDTFVARIRGKGKAEEASRRAREALEKGGMLTEEGRREVRRMDEEFRREDINPGTTADLTASSWMLALLLEGIRP
jgi:triphosphoribosyl-dephospho-CoA synthase